MTTTEEARGKLAIGRVVRQSLEAWRRDFWQLTALAVVLELPILVVELLWHFEGRLVIDTDAGWLPSTVSLPLAVYTMLSHHFLSGLIERFVGAERHGHARPTLRAVVRDLPWLRLFVADLLLALCIAVGLLLFIVPGFIAATMFSIVLPLITLERQPVLPTFRRSASLVRGNGGRAFVVWLGAALVTEAGAAIGGGLFHGIDSEAVQALAHAVPTTLLLPIAALPLVVMAFELLDRERVAAA